MGHNHIKLCIQFDMLFEILCESGYAEFNMMVEKCFTYGPLNLGVQHRNRKKSRFVGGSLITVL